MAVAVMYGVHCIIRVLLPFLWEKIDLGNRRSENAKSDRGKNHQREESDNSRLPKGLACLLVKDSGKDC